jgi:protein SCO1/2
LLSITLDPEFDTPQILKQYGESLHADPAIWSFVTGDLKEIEVLTRAFSVYRQTDGGTISHGLATALIDKDGKIGKIWRGNAWTPGEVIKEINQHAK